MYKFETKQELIDFLKSEDEEASEIAETIKEPLVKKRDDLLSELKDAKAKVSEFNQLDVDGLRSKAEEADTVKKQLDELKRKSSEGDDKYDELRKSLEQEVAKEREKLDRFVTRYKETKVDNLISDAVSKHKGMTDLLKPVLRNRIKEHVTDDGNIEVEILSKEGKPYFINGEEATVEDLVKEFKQDDVYSRCFEGSGASGSGTRPSNVKNNGPILDTNDPNYSLTEAMKHAKKHQ